MATPGGGAGPMVGGIAFMIFGAALLSATLITMNRKVEKPDEVRATLIDAPKMQKKKKPPPPKRAPKPKPKPRPSRRRAAPRPSISSNLGGLGAGINFAPTSDLGDLAGDLLDTKSLSDGMTMSEDSVDALPKLKPGSATPKYPPRARAKGIEGEVVLTVIIGADGRVKKAAIYSAEPEGVFEEVALSAVRNWSFEPATYQGQPVQMTLKLPLAFKLN